MYSDTALRLVSTLGARRPAVALPSRLDQLFHDLAAPSCAAGGGGGPDRQLWMHHPHRLAAAALERTASDIAKHLYDIAGTRLTNLVRACPDFAEAWNKRATLYYLQQRDEEKRSRHPPHVGAGAARAILVRYAAWRRSSAPPATPSPRYSSSAPPFASIPI